MSRLVRGTEVVGLPVVTLDGDDIAEIRDVVFQPDAGDLQGFTLNKRGVLAGRLKRVLTSDAVHAIGRDAVMVRDGSELVVPDDAPEAVAAPESDRTVTGASVVTESGTVLGEVVDVVLQVAETTDVVGYELTPAKGSDRSFVPLPEQIAVSGDALVVPDQLEAFLTDDFVGFGGAIESYVRDHGSRSGPGGAPARGGGARKASGQSKRELYEEAQRRDIRGRSRMTKAELMEALAEGDEG